MLIHVNPREVAGLQYLAAKHGTTLTINPDTGLPEAFNFMRFLPAIAGVALSPFLTPAGAAAAVGAVEGIRTKSVVGGLKGALGAYGGASLGTSLANFGAEGLGQSAIGSAIPEATATLNAPGAQILPQGVVSSSVLPSATVSSGVPSGIDLVGESYAVPQATTFSNVGPDQAGELLRSGQITPQAYANYGQTLSQGVSQYNPVSYSNIGEGISRAFTDPTAAGKAIMADPMRTIANVGSLALGTQETPAPYSPPSTSTSSGPGRAQPYKRNYRENPNPYDSREFEYFQPNALYVKEGGAIKMQTGGTPPVMGMPTGLPEDYKAYMEQLQQMINQKGSPASLPQFSTPIAQPRFATQMTPGTTPNAYYAPGGITTIQKEGQVRGDGDGMEDKVYGNIEGKQKVALSRDEFIVPADVVSGLGNGSSNAGAEKLYKMMDRVRRARTGIKKQGKQIKGDKYVPA
jgi:hypothetical protein